MSAPTPQNHCLSVDALLAWWILVRLSCADNVGVDQMPPCPAPLIIYTLPDSKSLVPVYKKWFKATSYFIAGHVFVCPPVVPRFCSYFMIPKAFVWWRFVTSDVISSEELYRNIWGKFPHQSVAFRSSIPSDVF